MRKIKKIIWNNMVREEELRRRTGQRFVTEKNKNKPKDVVWSRPENAG